MNLNFDITLSENCHSHSQKIRMMSEQWVVDNIYCVKCGHILNHFENNKPVADMYCDKCKEEFELKSGKSKLGKKIVSGAYSKMIEKIETGNVPNFFYLNYSEQNYRVKNFIIIPKHYFIKDIIIKRPPLAMSAKRAGWVGCNIDISLIPESGKLYIIKDYHEEDKNIIIEKFNKMLFLRKSKDEFKGWLMDILRCIELVNKKEFTLNDMYVFGSFLQKRHPDNKNVQAKIRQQLQILRDYNYICFTERGKYKLL